MRVFVAGGTGAIGRDAVDALVRRGHHVTALARTDDKAAWLTEHGAHRTSAVWATVRWPRSVTPRHR